MVHMRLYTFVRTHQIIYINLWTYIIWKLYLNKADLKKSYTFIHNICDPVSSTCNTFLRKILMETTNLYFSQFITKLNTFLKRLHLQHLPFPDNGGQQERQGMGERQSKLCSWVLVLPWEILLAEVWVYGCQKQK